MKVNSYSLEAKQIQIYFLCELLAFKTKYIYVVSVWIRGKINRNIWPKSGLRVYDVLKLYVPYELLRTSTVKQVIQIEFL